MSLDSASVDLFTYINTKFLYVETHSKKQLEHIYNILAYQQCMNYKSLLEFASVHLS